MIASIILGVTVFIIGLITAYPAIKARPQLAPPPQAVNVFGEIVLPEPGDPRWVRKGDLGCSINGCLLVMLQFGKVHSCIEHGVYVDGLDLGRIHDKTRVMEYCRLVREGYSARLALEEIESTTTLAVEPEQLLLSST